MEPTFSVLANRSQGARAVGGRLSLVDGVLAFEPNVIDAALGGKSWSAPLRSVRAFETEPAVWSLGNLFSGGLRARLAVVLDDGRELFVVNKLESTLRELQQLLER